jgi:hypothetical protein
MGRCVSRFGRLPKRDIAVPYRWVVELKHPALLRTLVTATAALDCPSLTA